MRKLEAAPSPAEDEQPTVKPDVGIDERPQCLKPSRFDGNSSLESFLAHFHKCATFNKWDEEEHYCLSSAVLWTEMQHMSSGTIVSRKLTPLLNSLWNYNNVFGDSVQLDKCRNGGAKSTPYEPAGETKQHLHSDIRRHSSHCFSFLNDKCKKP